MALVRNDKIKWSAVIEGAAAGDWMTAGAVTIDTTEKKIRPAAAAPLIAIGGSSTPGNVTVTRPLFPELDPHGKRYDQTRRNVDVKLLGQPLDKNDNVNGNAIAVSGVMKSWEIGASDANGNDEQIVTMEVSVDTIS